MDGSSSVGQNKENKSLSISKQSLQTRVFKRWEKCKRASLYASDDPASPLIQVLALTASHCILYISPVVTKLGGDM